MPAPKRKPVKPTDESAVPCHEDCWAKTTAGGEPGISVKDHCSNVGCVAEAILNTLPIHLKSELEVQAAPVLAALHDIGKVSPGFQSKCGKWLVSKGLAGRALQESWSLCESDHAKVSQFTLQGLLDELTYRWAVVIGSHHGSIKDERILPISEANHASWNMERQRLVDELTAIFGAMPTQEPREADLWFIAGLLTFAEWLGSNEDFFPQEGD